MNNQEYFLEAFKAYAVHCLSNGLFIDQVSEKLSGWVENEFLDLYTLRNQSGHAIASFAWSGRKFD